MDPAALLARLRRLRWTCRFVPGPHFLVDGQITFGLADPDAKQVTVAAGHPQWYAILAHEVQHAAQYADELYSDEWWERFNAGDPEFTAHIEARAEIAALDFLSVFSPGEVDAYRAAAEAYVARVAGVPAADLSQYSTNIPHIPHEHTTIQESDSSGRG